MSNRIRELREAHNMTQIRLSIELEVAQETISAYESGRHYPSYTKLVQMSDLFGVSIDYLMGRCDSRAEVFPSPVGLTAEEQLLLHRYRSFSPIQRAKAEAYFQGLSDQ